MAYELEKVLRAANPGASIAVPAGTYAVNLVIDKPISLVAMGKVVLDGAGRGPVVRIATAAGLVRLAGFLIAGGDSPEGGGGVSVHQGQVELLECTLRYNKSPLYGGGGLLVTNDARVTATRCRFEGNTARQGGAILVDELGALTLNDSTVAQNAAVLGGGVKVREGAKVELLGCTIADNKVVGDDAAGAALHLGGSSTRTPTVKVSHCILSERTEGPACVANQKTFPGALTLERNLLPPWCAALGGDNRFEGAKFTMQGTEPYQLQVGSPALGAAREDFFAKGAKDLVGKPRHAGTTPPALGAFALSR
jgi:predicted outer membrane repeat protein